jgi:hypothetical protein
MPAAEAKLKRADDGSARWTWAPFPGFSLLFEVDWSVLKEFDPPRPPWKKLVDTTENLYRDLSFALPRPEDSSAFSADTFLALPSATYHVTVWDGLNQGNLSEAYPILQSELRPLLSGMPDTATRLSQATVLDAEAALQRILIDLRGIRLSFDAFDIWGLTSPNPVLVAKLTAYRAARRLL